MVEYEDFLFLRKTNNFFVLWISIEFQRKRVKIVNKLKMHGG